MAMKKVIGLAIAAGLTCGTAGAAELSDAQIQERVQDSRQAVMKFGKTLKGELQKAMKSGGPVNAIGVCQEVAPAIASDISEETGWEVYRTSLKPRNVAPDNWETAVLESFDRRRELGESPKKMEFVEVVEKDGEPKLRYMKALGTAPVCLTCHGTDISADVQAEIDKLYPNDKATGYKAGEIRGAFSIIQDI